MAYSLAGTWVEEYVLPNTENYTKAIIQIDLDVNFHSKYQRFIPQAGDIKEITKDTQLDVVVIKSKQLVTPRYRPGYGGELDYDQDSPISKEFQLDIRLLTQEKVCLNHLLASLQPLITENIVDQRLLEMICTNNLATRIRECADCSLRYDSNKLSFKIIVEVCTREVISDDNHGDFMDDDGDHAIQSDYGIGLAPASPSAVKKIIDMEIDNATKLECSICLEESGEKVVSLPCKHMFHKPCIVPWFGIKSTCPLCRHQLPVDSRMVEELDLSSESAAPR